MGSQLGEMSQIIHCRYFCVVNLLNFDFSAQIYESLQFFSLVRQTSVQYPYHSSSYKWSNSFLYFCLSSISHFNLCCHYYQFIPIIMTLNSENDLYVPLLFLRIFFDFNSEGIDFYNSSDIFNLYELIILDWEIIVFLGVYDSYFWYFK